MSSDIRVVWASKAEEDIADKTKDDFGGVEPRTFHEAKVKAHWDANKNVDAIKDANKARIRRGAHTGGSDPTEADHITVSYRKGAKELKTVHVYTGR